MTTAHRPRIAFADDHRMVAEGILRLLEDDYDLVGLATDGPSLLALVRDEHPDLVVTDLNMPGASGLDVMQTLRGEGVATPFVFLTMHADPPLVAAALRAGAQGYVPKVAAGDELLAAVEAALEGRTYLSPSLGEPPTDDPRGGRPSLLTPKQREVLGHVAAGLRSRQIADAMGVSVRTVEAHKYSIMQALDVHSTLELVRRARELGLLY
jgi:DNA-binding NarL/FixJ family response regulator